MMASLIKKLPQKTNPGSVCPWCCQPSEIIWIHGHGQCSLCGTNIDECCRGEQCDTPPGLENSDDENTG
jgi:hypothetical protein